MRTHDSLVIKEDGSWFWNSTGIRGKSALDYLTEVEGMRLPDAVQTLCGWQAAPTYRKRPAPEKRAEPPPPFKLPRPCGTSVHAAAYLQERGIDGEIISRCLRDKSLYEGWAWKVWEENGEKKFEKHRACVFVGRDKTGKAQYAAMRGVTEPIKRDATSSKKEYGFAITGTGAALYACEAPIDALSRATLDKLDGKDWRARHYLSLGGTAPLALVQYLTDHPGIKTVYLCQDNDRAGIISMIKAQKAIRENGLDVTVRIEPPPISTGKDYNDKLKAVRAAMREPEREQEIKKQRSMTR